MTEHSGHKGGAATTPEAAADPGASVSTSSSDVADRTDGAERIVVFRIGEQCYALPMSRVQEVQQIVAFSEVPGAWPAVVGMVDLRGRVIPAVDVRSLFGLEARQYTLQTPMLICEAHDQVIALVVDEVLDVVATSPDSFQAAPPMHALARAMIGVCRLESGVVYVFDPDRLVPASIIPEGA